MLNKILNKILKKFGKIYLKKKVVEETRSPELMAQISKGSLLKYYGNIHSQIGQDGILQEIFKKLGPQNPNFLKRSRTLKNDFFKIIDTNYTS